MSTERDAGADDAAADDAAPHPTNHSAHPINHTAHPTNHRKDFSAGGVVVRDDQVVVIVPKRRGNQGGTVLGLPKGHPDGDESEVDAATREVREETGVIAEPVARLGEIRYSYERRGQPIDKRVVFYLFEYRSGELSHDHEIEQVQWMPLHEAVHSLT